MTNLEFGDKVAYVQWESKHMECQEYVPVSNPLQFNYDVKSLYQKIIAWGGLSDNGSFLQPFFYNNVNEMSYFEILNEVILPALVLLFPVTISIL